MNLFLLPCLLFLRVYAQGQTAASLPAERQDIIEFDWVQQRVSVSDLGMGLDLPFVHGTPGLTDSEAEAYRELYRVIEERRYAAAQEFDEALTEQEIENLWQSSFYKFEAARRRAWRNGQLELQGIPGEADDASHRSRTPFGTRPPQAAYSLLADIATYPDHFVGRPIVLYGMFIPKGQVELPPSRYEVLQKDEPPLAFQGGVLKDLSNSRTLAMVHAAGYITPYEQMLPTRIWPTESAAIPVMVKGWFIKRWGQYPLVMTESVRILYPKPYDAFIERYAQPRRPMTSEEEWIYYETLRQMQLTNAAGQSQIAATNIRDRINDLMSAIQHKTEEAQKSLASNLRQQKITEQQYHSRSLRLERQLAFRLQRHREYLTEPDKFPLYVDVFQHPQVWTGKLLTLHGHVRRVTSYTGSSEFFGSQTLHELWLYTDDSQRNPAVIVTPNLPPEFPVGAEVVDRVTVTGCFFKPYVYRAEQDHRIAPLILAGRIFWSPTDDQIRSLANEGSMPADSATVIAARKRNSSNKLSETGVMLLGFVALVVMMMIWGRVQRDRRERRRLLEVVESQRDFDQHLIDPVLARLRETSQIGEPDNGVL
ncbi:MAG: hypothetical protein KDA91_15015 [Planctomycetaceae bacterium]|nr:hypothetical protein [Planctomycetaceae bacterium]